jgi:hypothetical protein
MDEEYIPKMTDLDRRASSEPIQIMKALLPYAPPNYQRLLSLYAKTMELTNIIQFFRENPSDVSICASPQNTNQGDPLAMINQIRDYCSPQTQEKLDHYLNVFAMFQMMSLFQDQEE